MGKTEKNVLLLNMSMLQGNNTNFYYSDMDVTEENETETGIKRCFFRGTSALEPGTKNILYRLASQDRKIDKIIILATPETQGENKAVEVYKKNIKKYLTEGEDGVFSEAEIIENFSDGEIDVPAILECVKKYKLEDKIKGLKLDSSVLTEIEKEIYDSCVKDDKKEAESEDNPGAKEFEEFLEGYDDDQKKKLQKRLNTLLEKNISGDELDKYEILFEKHSINGSKLVKLGEKLERIPLLRMRFLSHCYAKQMFDAKKDAILVQTMDKENKELAERNQELFERNQELLKMISKLQNRIEVLTNAKKKKNQACIRACLIMKYYDFMKEYRLETNMDKLSQKSKMEEYTQLLEQDSEFFKVIKMESVDVRYDAIPEVVETITNMKSQDDNEEEIEIKLHLDMQGGARIAIFVINSVINMLQSQKHVSLERSYSIAYSTQNWINEIRDETMSNHVLDLVSGMDEFINYGKAKKLREYYNFYKKERINQEIRQLKLENGGRISDTEIPQIKFPEDEIISCIDKISNAMAVSSVTKFIDGISELKKTLGAYEEIIRQKESGVREDALLKNFVGNLEKEYGEVLKADAGIIDIVDWCVKKGLYQQALSVFESKMPEQMAKDGILHCCCDANGKQEKIKELNSFISDGIIIAKDETLKLEDIYRYYVKYYAFDKQKKEEKEAQQNPGSGKNTAPVKKDILQLLKDGDLCSMYYSPNTSEAQRQINSELKGLFSRYYSICKIRNNTNHAWDGDEDQINKIKAEMPSYVVLYRTFLETYGKKGGYESLKIVKDELDRSPFQKNNASTANKPVNANRNNNQRSKPLAHNPFAGIKL